MSKLDELIQELCPDGVEYKAVGNLSKTLSPQVKIKSHDYIENGKYPVIDQGQNFIGGYTNDSRVFPAGEYIIFGDHTCVVKYIDFPFVQGADGVKVLVPQDSIICKYLYYCMCNIKMDASYARHWSKMRNERIPLPPLPVQQEIVRILDSFTQLTAELTARRKQYEHYRDELLTFGDDVPHINLGQCCSLITKGTTPKSYSQSGVAFIKTEAILNNALDHKKLSYIDLETHHGKLKRSILEENDLLITIAGATIGKCMMVPPDILPANTNQALGIIRLNKSIVHKYVFYVLQSKYMQEYISLSAKGSAQPNLNLEQLNSFRFPLPSYAEQERIVNILDRFDTLCNDLSSGLPAEIEARQKQYEYYRDKLLSFKELTV